MDRQLIGVGADVTADTENRGLVSLFLISLALFSLPDILAVLIVKNPTLAVLRPILLGHGGWLFFLPGLLVAFLAKGRDMRAYLGLGACLVINLFLLLTFRGPWLWAGTFDSRSTAPISVWLVPLLLGPAAGILISRSKTPRVRAPWWLGPALAGLATILVIVCESVSPAESLYPPMRGVLLLAMTLFGVLLMTLQSMGVII